MLKHFALFFQESPGTSGFDLTLSRSSKPSTLDRSRKQKDSSLVYDPAVSRGNRGGTLSRQQSKDVGHLLYTTIDDPLSLREDTLNREFYERADESMVAPSDVLTDDNFREHSSSEKSSVISDILSRDVYRDHNKIKSPTDISGRQGEKSQLADNRSHYVRSQKTTQVTQERESFL